jgi:hypothetical protein
MDRHRTAAGPARPLVPADPEQVKPGKSVDESQKCLGMQGQRSTHLLVPVHPSLLEEGQEMPGLGMGEDVGQVPRWFHHHIR